MHQKIFLKNYRRLSGPNQRARYNAIRKNYNLVASRAMDAIGIDPKKDRELRIDIQKKVQEVATVVRTRTEYNLNSNRVTDIITRQFTEILLAIEEKKGKIAARKFYGIFNDYIDSYGAALDQRRKHETN